MSGYEPCNKALKRWWHEKNCVKKIKKIQLAYRCYALISFNAFSCGNIFSLSYEQFHIEEFIKVVYSSDQIYTWIFIYKY